MFTDNKHGHFTYYSKREGDFSNACSDVETIPDHSMHWTGPGALMGITTVAIILISYQLAGN